jgi:hypothetical protein
MRSQEPTPLEPEMDRRLQGLGFDPGWPVFRHSNNIEEISVEHIRAALFDSEHQRPVTVPFAADDGCGGGEVPMLVLWAQPVWIPNRTLNGIDVSLDCFNLPDWYLRGVLLKDHRHPDSDPVTMHAYVQGIITSSSGGPGLDAYVQIIPEASPVSDDQVLMLSAYSGTYDPIL